MGNMLDMSIHEYAEVSQLELVRTPSKQIPEKSTTTLIAAPEPFLVSFGVPGVTPYPLKLECYLKSFTFPCQIFFPSPVCTQGRVE